MAAAPESWTLDYTLTPDDYIRFSVYTWDHSPYLRRRRWSLRLQLVCWFLILATLVHSKIWLSLRSALLFILASAFMIAFARPLGRWSAKRETLRRIADGAHDNLFVPTHTMIDATGIHVSNSDGLTNKLPWKSVVCVAIRPEGAYIYITSTQAYILPRRGFEEHSDFDRFVKWVAAFEEPKSPRTMIS